jgi:hypothetical protein
MGRGKAQHKCRSRQSVFLPGSRYSIAFRSPGEAQPGLLPRSTDLALEQSARPEVATEAVVLEPGRQPASRRSTKTQVVRLGLDNTVHRPEKSHVRGYEDDAILYFHWSPRHRPDLSPRERLKLTLRLQVDLADVCDIRNADVRIINDAPLILQGKVCARESTPAPAQAQA